MQLKQIMGLFLLLLLLLCLCSETESRGVKKWRAHLKKRCSSPRISATFRMAHSKKSRRKHKPKRNRKHSAHVHPAHDFYLRDSALTPSYYLASSYPRWRAFKPFEFGSPALRRADNLGASGFSGEYAGVLSSDWLDTLNGFNGHTNDMQLWGYPY